MTIRQARLRRRQTILYIAVAAVVILFLGVYGTYRLDLQPAAGSGGSQRFEVKAGERAPQIATRLKEAGLIRNRNAFLTYINFHGLRTRLKAGVYALSPTKSGQTIARLLTDGRVDAKRLVVPEGSKLADIEQLAARHGITATDFKAALAAPHSDAFLSGKPATVSLEGYLFPDSYQIESNTTAAMLVNTMLKTFGQRVGPEYVRAFAAQGLTLHQGLTVASIVEREVSRPEDRPVVAQVFLKRFREGIALGSDPTTDYAAALTGVPFNLSLDSPYNTYRYAGLPPGPICSPGLPAMDAVARPADTSYLYFLSDKTGKTHYTKTFAEHQRNIDKYLR